MPPSPAARFIQGDADLPVRGSTSARIPHTARPPGSQDGRAGDCQARTLAVRGKKSLNAKRSPARAGQGVDLAGPAEAVRSQHQLAAERLRVSTSSDSG